jgi:glutaminyl-tRNA synthetase
VKYDDFGNIVELQCTYDPNTKSGSGFDERKPNGNIHFVEGTTAQKAVFNLFEPLMVDSDSKRDLGERLNPNSWKEVNGFVEADLEDTVPLERFQFIRKGYFVTDYDSIKEQLIFNQICELRSTYK